VRQRLSFINRTVFAIWEISVKYSESATIFCESSLHSSDVLSAPLTKIDRQQTLFIKVLIECRKCSKTRLSAYVISKFFREVIPRNPTKKGREGEEEREQRGKKKRGRRKGEERGREGRGSFIPHF
jgi:hypothetical protein